MIFPYIICHDAVSLQERFAGPHLRWSRRPRDVVAGGHQVRRNGGGFSGFFGLPVDDYIVVILCGYIHICHIMEYPQLYVYIYI